MTWWEYVQQKAQGATQAEIAEKTGIAQSSVARWRTVSPKSDNAVAFAHAYKRPVLEALIAAGVITEQDAQITEAPQDLTKVELEDLLSEALRRVKS